MGIDTEKSTVPTTAILSLAQTALCSTCYPLASGWNTLDDAHNQRDAACGPAERCPLIKRTGG